jgi:hypothetical protein
MNILDKIIVDKSHSQKINHSCFSIRSLCLSQKDYIISENLKNSTTGIIEHISVVLHQRQRDYSFTVEEVVKDMKMLVLVEFRY